MSLETKFKKEHWIIISGILAVGVIVAAYYIESTTAYEKQQAQQAAQSVESGAALSNAAGATLSTWWSGSLFNPSNWFDPMTLQ
jgi:uncharacterized protein YpmB